MAITERVRLILDVVTGDAKQALNGLSQPIDKAQSSFSNLGKAASSAFSWLDANPEKALAGIATAVGAFVVKSVQGYQEAALAAGKFSDATGTSVEDASRLIEVFGDIGVSAETVQSGINKMNVQLGKNGEAFEELGLKGQTTTDTFINVIKYLNSIDDPTLRASEATKLLGKNWQSMAEVITAGAGDLQASMAAVSKEQVFNDDDVRKARQFRDSLDYVSDAVTRFQNEIGGEVLQNLGTWLNLVTKIAERAESLGEKLGGTGNLVKSVFGAMPGGTILTTGFEAASKAVGFFDDKLGGANETTKKAAQTQEDAAQQAQEMAAAQEDAAKAAAELEASMTKLVNAQLRSLNTNYAEADAWDDVQESLDKANKTADDGATSVNEKAAADRKAVESALKYVAAADASAKATAEANNQQYGAQQSAEVQIAALQRVKAQFPQMGPVIDAYIGKLQQAATPVTTPVKAVPDYNSVDVALAAIQRDIDAGRPIHVPASLMFNPLTGAGGLMAGGTARPGGQWSWVGEQGRELAFLPGGTHVYSHGASENMVRGNGSKGNGGNHYSITINVPVGAQPADIGRELVSAISAYERANGAGWRGN